MILVTGATGLVGEALIRELHSRGEKRIKVLIYRDDERSWDLDGLDIIRVRGDVRDKESLVAAFEGVSKIYHCAALISIVKGEYEELHATNVVGVENVVEAAAACGVKRIVHLSSVEAIGDDKTGATVTEEMGFRPEHAIIEYGKSKALGSIALLARSAKLGVETVIVCPGGIIGPHDFKMSKTGKMIWDASRGKLPGWVEGSFGFVDSRDVASLCVQLMESDTVNEHYIAVAEHYSVDRILTEVENLSGRKRPMKMPLWLAYASAFFVELWHKLFGGDPVFTRGALDVIQTRLNFSTEKARALGWNPRPMTETIKDTHNWYAKNWDNIDPKRRRLRT